MGLRLLVELGLDVNGKPGDESPLHCAARAGQLDTVKLLVELGADVHARDHNFDGTPLSFANYKGQWHVVEYLLQFARIWDVVKIGGLDRLRTLLRENPDCVNICDDIGRTPLHYALKDTQHGEEIIELLLEHGADVNAKDNAGRTPIDQMLQSTRSKPAPPHRWSPPASIASRATPCTLACFSRSWLGPSSCSIRWRWCLFPFSCCTSIASKSNPKSRCCRLSSERSTWHIRARCVGGSEA
jgi:hypothetical protein